MPDPNLSETLCELAVARHELRSVRGVLCWVTGMLAFLALAPLLPMHMPPGLLSSGVVLLFSVSLGHQVSWWWEAREARISDTSAAVSTPRPDAT